MRTPSTPFFMILFACGAGCAPPAALVVQRADETGTVQGDGIVGRDGGATIRRDGADVWIFGDSFLTTKDVDGSGFHSSSYSLTGDLDASDGVGAFTAPVDPAGAPLTLLTATDTERAYNLAHQLADDGTCATAPCGARFATWPGTSVDVDGRILTFYGLIHAEVGEFNFQGLGQSIATWDASEDRPSRPLLGGGAHPTLLFNLGEPTFGVAAMVIDGDLYAFGCDTAGVGAPCKLARVSAAAALDRSAWTFFDGSGWSPELTHAAVVVDGAPIATVMKDEHLGSYVLVYSAPLSNDVVARTAPAITGPWSSPVLLFTADHGDDATVYDAYVHPELDPTGESLVVSYTRTTGPFASETVVEVVALR